MSKLSIPDLLTRAADAAGRAAAAATQGPRIIDEVRGLSRTSWTVECPDADGVISEISCIHYGDAALAAASGPDHWRAVEATLRGLLAEHDRYWLQFHEPEHHCRRGYVVCHGIEAARPLAEQVLRDLA